MSKLVTGVALGTSGGTILNGVLTKLSPDEWSAIGVLAGIAGIIVTGLINWYFKRKVSTSTRPEMNMGISSLPGFSSTTPSSRAITGFSKARISRSPR